MKKFIVELSDGVSPVFEAESFEIVCNANAPDGYVLFTSAGRAVAMVPLSSVIYVVEDDALLEESEPEDEDDAF